MDAEKKLINIQELSERTNVKVATLRKLVYQNRVPYVRIGRLVRFRPAAIDNWIDGLSGGPLVETKVDAKAGVKADVSLFDGA
jgi:excisionase family DNA binding protein